MTLGPAHLYPLPVEAPEHVQRSLEALGLPGRVRAFDESTHTAQEAANAVGCELGQIVKTLFFMAEGRPTMALVAGDRQVDTSALAELVGVGRKKLKMGTPDEVIEITGYRVGGVAPVGWLKPCDIVVDDSLRRFDEIWAAAGASNAVFPARTEDLVKAIGGQWATIVKEPA
jgi:Cys-tRNA(Pro) deacylase